MVNGQHEGRPTMIPATEILVPIALFALIFGIVYIVITAGHRQRMAMIDKGMDPGVGGREVPLRGLRNGLFMIGIGTGLFFGYLMDVYMPSSGADGDPGDTPLPYFIMVLLFGGLSLVLHHLIVRRRPQG
jgi:hypothetical protein